MTSAIDAVEDVFRAESGAIVASLVSLTKDLDLAQDAVQEAFLVASSTWPTEGVPANPAGWLVTTAKRKAIDRLRQRQRRAGREAQVARIEAFDPTGDPSGVDDDMLRLLFTCCHPALAVEARVALTLRIVCGLSTTAIARALLITEPTLNKRLVRTRARIRMSGIGYDTPTPSILRHEPGRCCR